MKQVISFEEALFAGHSYQLLAIDDVLLHTSEAIVLGLIDIVLEVLVHYSPQAAVGVDPLLVVPGTVNRA